MPQNMAFMSSTCRKLCDMLISDKSLERFPIHRPVETVWLKQAFGFGMLPCQLIRWRRLKRNALGKGICLQYSTHDVRHIAQIVAKQWLGSLKLEGFWSSVFLWYQNACKVSTTRMPGVNAAWNSWALCFVLRDWRWCVNLFSICNGKECVECNIVIL